MTLMDESGNIKEDLKVPEEKWLQDVFAKCSEILEEGKKECLFSVISAMGYKKSASAREGNNI